MVAPLGSRFVPPAPVPAAGEPSVFSFPFRLARSQIEAFPRALYTADVWKAPVPGGPLFVMSPEAVQSVLLDQADHFTTGALFRRMMRPAWGDGVLIAQGRAWRLQRRAASGAFRPADMAALTPIFAAAAERTVERWRGAPGVVLDVQREMAQLTFEVILDATLSGAADFDRSAMSDATRRLFARMGEVRLSAVLAPDRHHEGRRSIHAPEREQLTGMIRRMVARRRHAPPERDLVDLLMKARDPESGEGLSDALLVDNLLGFIMAGHETTTLALTWALFLVASHPPTRDRLRSEIKSVADRGPIEAGHVAQLGFTRQVIAETLRLYPPGYLLTRVAGRETTVGDQRVRAGQRVNIPVYAIHRREALFPDPHAFEPDRFASEKEPPSRFSYLPFGAGPRLCLGASFAMTEAIAVLATLVRAIDLQPAGGAPVWPVARLSLQPRGGMPMIAQAAA
jgi:cytochrome P450